MLVAILDREQVDSVPLLLGNIDGLRGVLPVSTLTNIHAYQHQRTRRHVNTESTADASLALMASLSSPTLGPPACAPPGTRSACACSST